jgi:hypothetical protein
MNQDELIIPWDQLILEEKKKWIEENLTREVKMKDQNILTDINWLKSAGDNNVIEVVDNVKLYIEYLEGQQDRLIEFEDIFNTILNGTGVNKDMIIAPFKELINEE